jgi:hypothetical protein
VVFAETVIVDGEKAKSTIKTSLVPGFGVSLDFEQPIKTLETINIATNSFKILSELFFLVFIFNLLISDHKIYIFTILSNYDS